MKDFQQFDKGGIAKSQLTTLLWFLWIWYALRKSSSNTEVVLQIILAERKLKVWSVSKPTYITCLLGHCPLLKLKWFTFYGRFNFKTSERIINGNKISADIEFNWGYICPNLMRHIVPVAIVVWNYVSVTWSFALWWQKVLYHENF